MKGIKRGEGEKCQKKRKKRYHTRGGRVVYVVTNGEKRRRESWGRRKKGKLSLFRIEQYLALEEKKKGKSGEETGCQSSVGVQVT